MTLHHDAHGFVGSGGTEGDFGNGNSAGAQGIGQGRCVTLGIGQLDYGDDTDLADSFLQFVHG